MKEFLKKLLIALGLMVIIIILGFLIQYYFTPFIYIVILYIISMPIFKFFNAMKINNKISGGLTLLFINLFLFFLIFYLGSELYLLLQKFLDGNFFDLKIIEKYLEGSFISKETLFSLESLMKNNEVIKKGAKLTTDGIVSYVFANIFVYFLLTDLEYIKESLKKLIPLNILKSLTSTVNKFRKMLLIEGALVFITTFEYLLGFWILGVEKSLFLAILCGILDILPYVGTVIVFIPLIIYNIIIKKYFISIGLILLYILSQIIREVLETKYVGANLELHPLIVLLSIYLGMKFLGIIGFVLGPSYILLLKEINYNTT